MPTSPTFLSTRRAPSHKKLIAFPWYGGKFSHLKWLLPLLPPSHHYCEPFGGSAAVLLNRDPSPIETYNDLDGDLVNFFRTLRDHPEPLLHAISLTPFSREEFAIACRKTDPSLLDPIERARRFYVRARQARNGISQTASLGNWRFSRTKTRSGMSGSVHEWLSSIPILYEVSIRLKRVQIEHIDALKCISLYDSPSTLFYCDPPYLHETRHPGNTSCYFKELTLDDHISLASALNSISGLAAVSGYYHPLLNRLYPEPFWKKTISSLRSIPSSPAKRKIIEVLWTNYDPKTFKRLRP